jgi:hypothetical protein
MPPVSSSQIKRGVKNAFLVLTSLAFSAHLSFAAEQCSLEVEMRHWTMCSQDVAFPNGLRYVGEFLNGMPHGDGEFFFANGSSYKGQLRAGVPNGVGRFAFANGDTYEGEWRDEKAHGRGVFRFSDGRSPLIGLWERDQFVRSEAGSESVFSASDTQLPSLEKPVQQAAKPVVSSPMTLTVDASQPSLDGAFNLVVRTSPHVVSLKVDGIEHGASATGLYELSWFARVGENIIEVVAEDRNGVVRRQLVTVNRDLIEQKARLEPLRPLRVVPVTVSDSVAIIIGIEKYRRISSADYASRDASAFYDYAVRALGVPPENIRLLLDEKAEAAEVLRAFKTWLPTRVNKGKTKIYVFYSGHGLPSNDGRSLYFLPHEVDRDLLARTAVSQKEVAEAIQLTNPRSVTMFIDSCYSGQSRTGETLLASARPITLSPKQATGLPENFTVISASALDQISSSSPELKHGIFSYYLMRGMEGEADANKDKQITVGEMQTYLSEKVTRRAMGMNRTQQPQVVGDTSRVLVGR